MIKKSLIYTILLSVILHSTPLFATGPEHSDRHKEAVERERIQITQEEYDKKIKTANTVMLTGAIIGGVGLATFATGMAIALTGEKKNLDSFGRALGGVLVGGIGGALMIGGGITAAVGAVKKGHTKKRYYTFSPIVDPQQDRYGMNLSVSF